MSKKPIFNLNVRLLSDGTVFYTFERDGKRYDGSKGDWAGFAEWLQHEVEE